MPRAIGFFAALVVASSLVAQQPAAPAKKVAATVNGREISEAAVERALKPVPAETRAKARPEVINYLIENVLVDYYLELLKIVVEPKEVDTQIETFKKQITDSKQDFAKVLEKMDISEAELRVEVLNTLRWEKFAAQQATDDKLKKLFEASPEIFDGSMVHARHILITPEANTDAGKAAALKKIQEIKAGIDAAIATATAKVPVAVAPLDRQRQINQATDDAFSAAAREKSSCPTKRDGGDLGEFPRMGMMVEAFSKAAFAMKPYEVSNPVETQYGYHLILVTGKKPGEAVAFEMIKGAVSEVYGARLREAIVAKMKADPNTKIDVSK
ncbi:MAG TPA: peptidylprolyl isomerase [Gemmataceae bacterium]|jgi:peptidyl-prolyl cis-trans isomerase C|nr:peptidylprolyl isomerase [Gemmataceae bacterium]